MEEKDYQERERRILAVFQQYVERTTNDMTIIATGSPETSEVQKAVRRCQVRNAMTLDLIEKARKGGKV